MTQNFPYKVVANNEYKTMMNKIIEADIQLRSQKYHYLDCIENNHIPNSFSIQKDKIVELTLKNTNDDVIIIPVVCVKINFDVKINTYNPIYFDIRNNPNFSFNIIRNNEFTFGITVGDLIRFCYFNNLIKYDNNSDDNDKNAKLFKKFINKSLTSLPTIDVSNVLGSFYKESFVLWEILDKYKFINDPFDASLQNLFNKMIYFRQDVVHSILDHKYDAKSKIFNTSFCVETFGKFLNKFLTFDVVNSIFKYFYFKEYPKSCKKYGDSSLTFEFEEPKSVPDILKHLYESTKNEKYIRFYHILMKPNKHENSLLDSKYLPHFIKNIRRLDPERFPFFALKNIYINMWFHSEFRYDDSDFVREIFINYKKLLSNDKSKSKYLLSNNFNTKNVHGKNYSRGYFSTKKRQTSEKKWIKGEMADLDD